MTNHTYRHTDAPFSASFKMHTPNGLNILFSVRGETASEHLAALTGYIAQLDELGYTVNAPGSDVTPDMKTEAITGYVVGERSDGQPCVYLYADDRLEYKVATVWQEQFDTLPFTVDVSQTWPGAAPKRADAERRGVFVSAEFEIALAPTGKQTESGRDVYRFDHVIGAAPASGTGFDLQPTFAPGSTVNVRGKQETVTGTVVSLDGRTATVEIDGTEYTVNRWRISAAA